MCEKLEIDHEHKEIHKYEMKELTNEKVLLKSEIEKLNKENSLLLKTIDHHIVEKRFENDSHKIYSLKFKDSQQKLERLI